MHREDPGKRAAVEGMVAAAIGRSGCCSKPRRRSRPARSHLRASTRPQEQATLRRNDELKTEV